MARLKKHLSVVKASRDEACLAARLYNDPSEGRSFEAFVVHMHLAWLYLLHAELTRDGVDYRYHRNDKPRLLVKVDGEAKQWELAKCVTHRWPSSTDPTRLNLEFFIGLRNKIEHRYARQQEALTVALGGHAQALLLNYEEELTSAFGVAESLSTRLRFPVFIGSFTDSGEHTLRKLKRALPAPLRTFVADFHAGLSEETQSDPRFEMRLRVTTELAPRDPDALALRFTKYDDLTDGEKAAFEELGRQGVVITKERRRPVVGYGLKKPKHIVVEVAEAIPFVFHMAHFTRAWKELGVRPPTGAEHPEVTDDRYCVYDERHDDYGYTPAYVKKLIRECSTEQGFRRLLGVSPKDKVTGVWVGEPAPDQVTLPESRAS